MQNHITRREAAKAIGLGTAAAFVTPAALADSNPDADILDLERQFIHVRDVEMPPLDQAASDAEELVMKAAPYQPEPKYTLAEIEKHQASMAETLSGDTSGEVTKALVLTKATQLLFKKEYGDMDPKAMAAKHFAADRKAAIEYQEYLNALEKAEAETGYHEKSDRAIEAADRAIALHEKILAAKPCTVAGLAVQLRTLIAGEYFALDISTKQISAVAESATVIAKRGA